MQKIDVEGVADLRKVGSVARGAVVVSLNLKIVAIAEDSLPAAHDVAAGKQRVRIDHLRKRLRIASGVDAFTGSFVVEIALQGESIAALFPIHAKTRLGI